MKARQIKTLVYLLDGAATLVLLRGDHSLVEQKLADGTGAIQRADLKLDAAKNQGSLNIVLRTSAAVTLEVAVVKDATAAAQVEEGDGYAAAVTNFRFIASTVWTTEEALQRMGSEAATD